MNGQDLGCRRWARGRTGDSAVVLQSIQRNAHERGVGDSEEVAKFNVCYSKEGKDLPPGGDEVFLNWDWVHLGQHVDEIMPCKHRFWW